MRTFLLIAAAVVLLPIAPVMVGQTAQPPPPKPAEKAAPKQAEPEQPVVADLAPAQGEAAPVPYGPLLMLSQDDPHNVPLPKIVGGDKEVKFGRLISLSVEPLTERPKDLYQISYAWRIDPEMNDLITWPDGARVIFGSGTESKTVKVGLIACYLFVSKDEKGAPLLTQRLSVTEASIKIVGTPAPLPDPVPNPTPDPDIPPKPLPDSGMAKKAYDWTKPVILDSALKKKDAAGLAGSFRSVVAQIGKEFVAPDGKRFKITDLATMLDATRISNNSTIPNTIEQWKPWFVSLSTALGTMQKEGKLKTLDDFIAVWNDIATGLAAAAR